MCLRLRIVPSHDVHRRAKVCESGFADKKGPDTSTASQSHGDADLERSMRVTSICLIANVVLNALGCLVTLLSLWPSGMPAQKVLSKAPCACRRESL